MSTAIVYGTNYGTSEKVAQILGEQIAGAVELINIKDIDNINIEEIDKLIIGCGIKIGKIPKKMKLWLNSNKENILKKQIYIYICAGEEKEDKINELFYLNFPEELLSKSKFTTCVGGEIDLDKVNFFIRILLRIVKKGDENTSTLDEDKIHRMAIEINKVKSDN